MAVYIGGKYESLMPISELLKSLRTLEGLDVENFGKKYNIRPSRIRVIEQKNVCSNDTIFILMNKYDKEIFKHYMMPEACQVCYETYGENHQCLSVCYEMIYFEMMEEYEKCVACMSDRNKIIDMSDLMKPHFTIADVLKQTQKTGLTYGCQVQKNNNLFYGGKDEETKK